MLVDFPYTQGWTTSSTLFPAHRPDLANFGVGVTCNGVLAVTTPCEDLNPGFAGIELIPDTTPAHWAIQSYYDATSITPGTSVQNYVQDWYTGVNDPTWSIVQGPGSIDSTGLLTLASGTYLGNSPLTVKATSQSTGYSATKTFMITGTKQQMANIRPAKRRANRSSAPEAGQMKEIILVGSLALAVWYPLEQEHKQIWIESYVKGPVDKPLKPSKILYKVAK